MSKSLNKILYIESVESILAEFQKLKNELDSIQYRLANDLEPSEREALDTSVKLTKDKIKILWKKLKPKLTWHPVKYDKVQTEIEDILYGDDSAVSTKARIYDFRKKKIIGAIFFAIIMIYFLARFCLGL